MNIFNEKLLSRAATCLQLAHDRGAVLATAESCTGGLLGGLFTSVAGISNVFYGGIITYHNSWKTSYLGVDATLLAREGAVNEAVARDMALGLFHPPMTNNAAAKDKNNVAITHAITHGIAITGLAGDRSDYHITSTPSTNQEGDGLVFIAVANQQKKNLVQEYHFDGDRQGIREQTLFAAMDLLEKLWQQET